MIRYIAVAWLALMALAWAIVLWPHTHPSLFPCCAFTGQDCYIPSGYYTTESKRLPCP